MKQFLSVGQRELESTLLWLEQPGHHLLLADSPYYPPRLRAIADYPGALFLFAEIWPCWAVYSWPLSADQLPLVRCSVETVQRRAGASWYHHYQRRLALTASLTAERARARGKTIGVLGNGLGAIYPRRHHALARKIVDSGEHCCLSFLTTSRGREISLVGINYQRTRVLACW